MTAGNLVDLSALAYAVVSLATAGVFAFAGHRLGRREVPPSARIAQQQFSLWWFAASAVSLIGGAESALAAVGALTTAVVRFSLYLELGVLCAALWGLVGYLLWLYTGGYRLALLTGFYLLVYALSLALVAVEDPTGFTVVVGRVAPTFAAPPPLALEAVVVPLLLAPEIGGAVAYISLGFRTRHRTVRFRCFTVGASLLAWFSLSIVAGAALAPTDPRQLLTPLMGALAAGLVVLGYYPSGWVRRTLGVVSVAEEPIRPAPELGAPPVGAGGDATGASPSPEELDEPRRDAGVAAEHA